MIPAFPQVPEPYNLSSASNKYNVAFIYVLLVVDIENFVIFFIPLLLFENISQLIFNLNYNKYKYIINKYFLQELLFDYNFQTI